MSLDQKVAEARRRRGLRTDSVASAGNESVLLSFRVPAALRSEVHQAARRANATSTQSWLTEVVERAVHASRSPHPEVVDVLLRRITEHLSSALDDGSYARWVAALDDPDLRD